MRTPDVGGAVRAARAATAITPATALRLRRAGIKIPYRAATAAKRAGVPLWLACSVLVQETGGGTNEWGHDPTIFVGGYDARNGKHWGPTVTRAAYAEYKRQRGPDGRGGMQGCGVVQLTWYSTQDAADAIGGCWDPLCSMVVGFASLAANVSRHGLFDGIALYNGSGPAAQKYAQQVLSRRAAFSAITGEK